jgi:hypothetical protein
MGSSGIVARDPHRRARSPASIFLEAEDPDLHGDWLAESLRRFGVEGWAIV